MPPLLVKQPSQILGDMLRVYRAGLTSVLGIDNPQTDSGSDVYLRFQAIANELGIGLQNIVVQADALMPDSATGTDLDRICTNYGLTRKPATPANGVILITCSIPTLVPTGSQLISGLGLIYEVTSGGTFSDQSEIQISSVDAGFSTNLPAGDVLTWISTPAYTQSTAVISSDIATGSDIEDDNTLRTRLFSTLQNPPLFGNWQDTAQLAESFSTIVQKAFVHPACQGPGTQHIALVGYTNSESKSRTIPKLNVKNLVGSIVGNLPAYTNTVVTTVQDAAFDVSFKLTIPYPVGADNLGTGGGWIDYSPWPIPNASGAAHDGGTYFAFGYVAQILTAGSVFKIAAPTDAPISSIIGNSISWIDKAAGWKVRTAKIVNLESTASPILYKATIDSSFDGLAIDDYIFPSSTNGQIYLDAILAKFALMGPGEKTNISSLIANGRALRKPRPNLSWPNTVDASMLRALTNSGTEVLDCDFYARRANPAQPSAKLDGSADPSAVYDPNAGIGGEVGNAAPALPVADVTFAPIIYIPNRIGFYPSVS